MPQMTVNSVCSFSFPTDVKHLCELSHLRFIQRQDVCILSLKIFVNVLRKLNSVPANEAHSAPSLAVCLYADVHISL